VRRDDSRAGRAAGQRARPTRAHRARRDRSPAARSGADAAPPRFPGCREGVGSRAPQLARRRRQRRRRLDGHAVRGAATLTKLAAIVDALRQANLLVEAPSALPEITGITADTRRLIPGSLYCAVRGAAADGHAFVAAAASRGAAAALVEERQGGATKIPQIVVRDGRRAAAAAAEVWYGRPAARLKLVGVTGTNGKTTSVTLARHVLAGPSGIGPMGSIGTLGAFDPSGAAVESEAGNLTTPGPIDLQATLAALIDRGAAGVAMEVSSHSLDQGRVDGLAFRAAIFTNLTRDHLDYHETFDAYFAAKAKLVGYLADAGLAVINADDAAWARLPPTPRRITFSAAEHTADVKARDVRVDAKGAHFTMVTTQGKHPVHLPLLGRFNVANALG